MIEEFFSTVIFFLFLVTTAIKYPAKSKLKQGVHLRQSSSTFIFNK